MMNKAKRILLYDADCKLCTWYTGKFEEMGLLEKGEKQPYTQAGPYTKQLIDMKRAKTQIALLNKETGQVWYGFESLVEIISQRWNWVKQFATIKIFSRIFGLLYNFISYNRKIIAPTYKHEYLTCFPDENWLMRMVFVFLCMAGVEWTAGSYFTQHFQHLTRFAEVPFRESMMFAAQLLFQAMLLLITRKHKFIYEYWGHLAFVGFLGGMMLFLGNTVLYFLPDAANKPFLTTALLGAVIMWMYMEHARRIKISNLPQWLSYSWVLFRIVLFFIIFKNL